MHKFKPPGLSNVCIWEWHISKWLA